MREGLATYRLKLHERNLSVNIYQNARVAGFFAVEGFFGLELQVIQDKGKRAKSWAQAKKLMYG